MSGNQISQEMESQIKKYLSKETPLRQILVTANKIPITRATLNRLQFSPEHCNCEQSCICLYLNDDILMVFLWMIEERSKMYDHLPDVYAIHSSFWHKLKACGYESVKHWTRNVDLFSDLFSDLSDYDILIPTGDLLS